MVVRYWSMGKNEREKLLKSVDNCNYYTFRPQAPLLRLLDHADQIDGLHGVDLALLDLRIMQSVDVRCCVGEFSGDVIMTHSSAAESSSVHPTDNSFRHRIQ